MILMEWDQYSIVGFFVIDFIFFKILNYPITLKRNIGTGENESKSFYKIMQKL